MLRCWPMTSPTTIISTLWTDTASAAHPATSAAYGEHRPRQGCSELKIGQQHWECWVLFWKISLVYFLSHVCCACVSLMQWDFNWDVDSEVQNSSPRLNWVLSSLVFLSAAVWVTEIGKNWGVLLEGFPDTLAKSLQRRMGFTGMCREDRMYLILKGGYSSELCLGMEFPLPFVENIGSGAVFSKSFYLSQYSVKASKPGFYCGLSQAIKLLKTPSLLGEEGKKGPWKTALDFFFEWSIFLLWDLDLFFSETHNSPRIRAQT